MCRLLGHENHKQGSSIDLTPWPCVFLQQILRTDICMDLGKSINPTIDIGQVHAWLRRKCFHALSAGERPSV